MVSVHHHQLMSFLEPSIVASTYNTMKADFQHFNCCLPSSQIESSIQKYIPCILYLLSLICHKHLAASAFACRIRLGWPHWSKLFVRETSVQAVRAAEGDQRGVHQGSLVYLLYGKELKKQVWACFCVSLLDRLCIDAMKIGVAEFPGHVQMCPEMVKNLFKPALTCNCFRAHF